jgi:hypothetical protein
VSYTHTTPALLLTAFKAPRPDGTGLRAAHGLVLDGRPDGADRRAAHGFAPERHAESIDAVGSTGIKPPMVRSDSIYNDEAVVSAPQFRHPRPYGAGRSATHGFVLDGRLDGADRSVTHGFALEGPADSLDSVGSSGIKPPMVRSDSFYDDEAAVTAPQFRLPRVTSPAGWSCRSSVHVTNLLLRSYRRRRHLPVMPFMSV